MRVFSALSIAFAVSMLAACGGSAEEPTASEPTATTSEMLEAGCHTVCPHCPPNQVCPAIACYVECNKPTKCTQTQLCIQGYVWSDTACACVPQ